MIFFNFYKANILEGKQVFINDDDNYDDDDDDDDDDDGGDELFL